MVLCKLTEDMEYEVKNKIRRNPFWLYNEQIDVDIQRHLSKEHWKFTSCFKDVFPSGGYNLRRLT